jgi:dTDP-4-amino-4,6-dideoxygalactose transaminase
MNTSVKVRYQDLSIQDEQLRAKLLNSVDTVLKHGMMLLGPEVEEFEKLVAKKIGCEYAVGMANGTCALFVALRCAGVGHGDEVIVPCLSWIASANAIALTGARPVFVDINEDYNLNCDEVIKAISNKTKAIMPVHLRGKMCDMQKLIEISNTYKIPLVEDAAQAFGSYYDGKMAGSFGLTAGMSLNGMKNLGACGEAGLFLTNSKELYEMAKTYRYNGTIGKKECQYESLNFRINTVQAAMLLVKLESVEDVLRRKREIAEIYMSRLKDLVGLPLAQKEKCHDSYYSFTLRTRRRDELKSFLLNEKRVETTIEYTPLMYQHGPYKNDRKGACPVGEALVPETLSLPCHAKLTDDQVFHVCKSVREFFER